MADNQTVAELWQEFLRAVYPPGTPSNTPEELAVMKRLFFSGCLALLGEVVMLRKRCTNAEEYGNGLIALFDELSTYIDGVKAGKE